MSTTFTLPKSAVDQLKGFISLCKSKPEVIHNEELLFFKEYLISMGATLPPEPRDKPEKKPEPAKQEEEKKPAEPDVEMEVESEESDVELDMDGVIGDPNPDVEQDMGDPNKGEITDEEMDAFNDKRSEAMGLLSEVMIDILLSVSYYTFFRESLRKQLRSSPRVSRSTPALQSCSPREECVISRCLPRPPTPV